MALRDDLIPLVDEVRQDIIDVEVGLRLYVVKTRLRTWSGGQKGAGTTTDTDTTLSPKPKVRPVPPRWVASSGGKYRDGDRVLDRFSATLTEDDLTGGSLSAGQEFYWLIDDRPYTLVGEPEKQTFGWRIVLRPRRA